MEEAQASQAPVQRVADRAAQWYVPAALVLAALVWGLTGNIVRGITVLIVFCPCALVLATPTAIVASIGHAARRLILVKGGEFAETVGQTHIVGLDKTGTLTRGRPAVTQLVPLDTLSAPELLRLAASAERFSEHPLGIALRGAAEARQLPLFEPSGFRCVAGCGVEARVDGKQIRVGRLDWLQRQAVSVGQDGQTRAAELQATGHTVLAVASGQSVAGLIAVRDVLRPEAREAVLRLKAQSIRVVMVTGDNPRAAAAIAAEAGIDEVHSALLPEDKLRLVREWQTQGQRVAFIGDGINDAPALAAADIGVAMGVAGADVALETSDIAFLSEDLTRLPEIIALSRRALKVIRQNIAFSVGLNLLSVLAAGMGWHEPHWRGHSARGRRHGRHPQRHPAPPMRTAKGKGLGSLPLRWLALALLTAAGMLPVFAGEPARPGHLEPRYEEPKYLAGAIYAQGSDRGKPLFKFRRLADRSGSTLKVQRDYTYPDGKLAAQERVVYEGDALVPFELDELQIGAAGRAGLRRSADNAARGSIQFEYRPEPRARPKLRTETLAENTLIADMVGPFLAAHWDGLLRGEKVKCRFIVVPRRETVGFTFVKTRDSTWQGRAVLIVKMEASSTFVAALVNPLFFTIEKAPPHRVVEYAGRTTPKLQAGAKWKDLDAVTVFDWAAAR